MQAVAKAADDGEVAAILALLKAGLVKQEDAIAICLAARARYAGIGMAAVILTARHTGHMLDVDDMIETHARQLRNTIDACLKVESRPNIN